MVHVVLDVSSQRQIGYTERDPNELTELRGRLSKGDDQ
jgi:hypothetical protein